MLFRSQEQRVATCMKPPTAPTNSPSTSPAPNGESCPKASSECSNYFCRCADGAVVNSSFCKNGQCQQPSQHCESACQQFNHGKWTGTVGGGPGTSPSPSPSAEVLQYCARNSACEPANCVQNFADIEAKCPRETSQTFACAARYPACTSADRCRAEFTTLSNCARR